MSGGRRRRRAGRGAIWLIVSLLVGSAGLRAATEAVNLQSEAAGSDAGPQARVPAACTPSEDIAETLRHVGERQAQLDAREADVADREAALRLAREEIDANLARLAEAEAGLSALLSMAEGAAETDLARLTAVYERMKPKDAALVFGAMSPDFAAGFLARMRPEIAADILAGLDPDAAYTISVLLAGRNAAAPTE